MIFLLNHNIFFRYLKLSLFIYVKKLDRFMRILLHTCCAPCVVAPLAELSGKGHEIFAFFYNPNIMPYREFGKRLAAFREFAEKRSIPYIINEEYALESTLRRFLDRGNVSRCRVCYEIRLHETARLTAQKGFDAFTTTLLVSPYQEHKAICDAGEAAAAKFGVKFFHTDWRPLFNHAHEEAKAQGLYMQSYCGCIFSEEERYHSSLRKKMQNARRISVEGGS